MNTGCNDIIDLHSNPYDNYAILVITYNNYCVAEIRILNNSIIVRLNITV